MNDLIKEALAASRCIAIEKRIANLSRTEKETIRILENPTSQNVFLVFSEGSQLKDNGVSCYIPIPFHQLQENSIN